MSNNPFANVLSGMFVAASRANPIVEGDYIGEDGLWYCGKCHTPRQSRFTSNGKEYTPFSLCQCKVEEAEREKKAQEEAERAYYRNLQRQSAFADDKTRSFTFELDDKRNAEASKTAQDYAESFDLSSEWLILNGDCGTGKSFFAACICNSVMDKGFTAKFTSVSAIEKQYWDAENKNGVYDELVSIDLLVLDDFGAERGTDYMTEIAFNIIDSRLRSGKPLVVTTNLSSEELSNPKDRNQKRIFSRLYENSVFYTVTGGDRRKERLIRRMRK